ncbi:MAG: fabG 1 [Rhodoglobus sp.]|nr:fabG 1 [Rhodoglobus sp.]
MHVAIQGRRKDKLEEVAEEIAAAGGAKPVIVVAELHDEDAPQRIIAEAAAGLGHIDIVVNNAGASRALELDSPDSAWDEAFTLNFTRPRQIGTLAIPGMRERGWGRIINITGKSETLALNGAVCAKAAVHAWSKGVSRKVGGHGITVNCVAPGKIMSEQILRNYSPEFRERQAAEDIPVGRYGTPADMANMVTYLASPKNGYITGVVISVDGGLRRYQY